jgi:hypothetical protein
VFDRSSEKDILGQDGCDMPQPFSSGRTVDGVDGSPFLRACGAAMLQYDPYRVSKQPVPAAPHHSADWNLPFRVAKER